MQSPEQNLAFVLGMPRSGTTLLSVLLGGHPEVLARGEPWLMLALDSLGTTHPAHPADAELLRRATSDFLDTAAPRRLGAAARAIYGDFLTQEGKSWFVDKTPRYYLCLDLLTEAFPEARYFWMVRNPMDVAASFCDTWKFDLADAIERNKDHPALIDFMFGLPALVDHAARHEVCLVRYEALAADPEHEIARAFAHLSLDAPHGAARFGKLKGSSRFGDRKIRKTTAVHDRSIGSYRKIFSPEQLRTIAGGLGRGLMDDLGYAKTFDEISALGPIVDRSAELRGAAAKMVASRRRAAATGALQKDGSPVVAGGVTATLERRGAELTARLTAVEADLAAVRERADRLTVENRDLVRSARRTAQQSDALEADRIARGAVIDDLQVRLTAAEKDRAARLALVDTLDRQATQLSGELAESRREATDRLGLIEELDGARAELEALLARERADAERQAAELNADRAARGAVIDDLQAKLHDTDAERTALKDAIKGIERDREARLTVINRANMQLKAAEEDRRGEREVRDNLEARVAILTAAAAARLAAIEQLTADLAGAEEDRASRLVAIDAMAVRIAQLESRLEEAIRDGAARLALIEQLDGTRAGLEAALAEAAEATEKQVAELNDDRAARGTVIKSLTERIDAVEAAHAARGSAIEAIERDRAARLSTIDRLVLQLKAAEAERLAERGVRDDLTTQVASLTAAAAERLDSIERLTAQLGEVQRDHSARLAVIEEIGQQAAAMSAMLGQIGTESAARLAVIEELDAARSALIATIEAERVDTARQVAELNEDRVARGGVIDALQADLARAEAERHARAAELAGIERDREARLKVINEMVLTLKAAEADRVDGLAVRDRLNEEVALFRAAAAERLALIERLTSDLASLEADRTALGERVETLDRTLRERDDAIGLLQGALDQAKRERQADREAADVHMAQMEERLSEVWQTNIALGRQWSPRLKTMLKGRR